MSLPAIDEWDESYLQSLIRDQVQENIHLDYKGSEALDNTEAKKNEISKDVSSFANSDGGILIYGMEESGHIPTRINGVVVAPGKREWLEQVINSRIQPKIDGLKIKQIDLTSQPGHAVFVIQIPIGFTAHQAHDFRYYRRYNFQSVPMHDYEVKMVINRFREPVIELNASTDHGKEVSLPIDGELQLVLEIENRGKVSAKSALVKIFLPTTFRQTTSGEWSELPITEYAGHGVRPFEVFIGPPIFPPIYPGIRFRILGPNTSDIIRILSPDEVYQVAAESMERRIEIPIFYEIYAEDMAANKGKTVLRIQNSFLRVIQG